jgi:hypothetical protein
MAELFTIIGEALVLLAQVIAAWAHALLEGLIVLVCFLFSRRFRVARLETWRLHPRKKIADLGLATLWFAVVIALPCFLFLLDDNQTASREPVDAAFTKANTNEDLRVELRTMRTNDQKAIGTVSVKKGGVAKILGTKSLQDLKTQLVENVLATRGTESNASPAIER